MQEDGNGKKDRVSIWSISEDRAVKFHAVFYGLAVTGVSIVSYRFGSQIYNCGWNWIDFKDLISSLSAVAISSAILTLIIVDGGGMLVEAYRAMQQKKVKRAREEATRQVLQDISHADVVLPDKLQKKYQKYLVVSNRAKK